MSSRDPHLPVSVEVFDTTLRDGAQTEGISYSLEDKIRIAEKLDELGVAFIEGGWPGSNPKDAAFFDAVRTRTWRHARIVAFGATRRANIAPADDPSVQALVAAGTEVCCIFGKSSVMQVEEVLRTTREENLRMIEETVAYLRAQGKRVIYDGEHFFDAFDVNPDYALATFAAARRGGAETLVLCDTNGGHLPWQVEATVRAVRAHFGPEQRIGVHTHDDTGCAVANTVAGVLAGAAHVQGTMNGYGERCGNANLCVVVPNLELKLGVRALPPGALARLHEAARFVAEVANLAPNEHMAYVGRSAFAHKAGVHVSAMLRHPDAYQHIDPAKVGNGMRVVVSELSGRANLVSKAGHLGLDGLDAQTGARVIEEVKTLENEGFSFEAAEASVALLVRRRAADYVSPFSLVDYRVMVSRHDEKRFAEATIKLQVEGQETHTAASGEGPVHAFDRALRKALEPHFPVVRAIQLADYKVRILNGGAGTAAITRVLIDWHTAERRWSTVGAGPNILEATWLALADGYEFGLAGVGVSAGAKAEAVR